MGRGLVQQGHLYRLRPPTADGLTAVEYVARDGSEVVVIAWLHRPIFEPAVRYASQNVDGSRVSSAEP
ncbi:hypothetical protein [Actinopolymorpha alba]|uniref:hypothetical protein n=1 Tax=Actinopolymorpha alba TaxID=533267 RepID=UPI0012F67F09|nr:hypothetical protein [Actinopolymorpha alba]